MFKINKENEKKFRQSEHGKKIHTYNIIGLTLCTIIIIVEIYINFDTDSDIYPLIQMVEGIIIALSCYWQGKYYGALEMYNKRLK